VWRQQYAYDRLVLLDTGISANAILVLVFVQPNPFVRGAIPLNRARIAAHLGDSARAVELLEEAIQRAALVNAEGVGTVGSDAF
jgi:hypothetical protein